MDTLRQIADEVIEALAPLVDAAQDPEKLQGLLANLGWTPNAVPQPVREALASGASLLDLIGSGAEPIDSVEAVARVTRLAAAVNAIANSPDNAFPGGIDVATFKATIARDLLDYAFAAHLLHNRSELGALLKLAGILRLTDTPAAGARQGYLKYEVAWNRLGTLLTDPARGFREVFEWESSTPRSASAGLDVGGWLESLGLRLSVFRAAADLLAFVNAGATTPVDNSIVLDLAFDGVLPETASTLAGFQLVAFPPTAVRSTAIGLLPYAHLGGATEVQLSDTLSLTIGGTADFTRGIAIILAPGQQPEVKSGFLGGVTAVPPEVRLGLKLTPAPGEPERRLLGAADASRLAINTLGLAIGARLVSPNDLDAFVEVQADCARIVVKPAPDESDSFLASLLGSEGISAEFSFGVRLSSRSGFGFTGSGGLEASFPLHVALGPVEFQAITLGLKPRGQDVDIEVGATVVGKLGPLGFVVEGAGFKLTGRFPDPPTGNLGPVDLGFGFKPPNGVGLVIDTGVVKGGGFLRFDSDKEEYEGMLELDLSGIVSVKAIGLITTRMPDGSKGFSLLLIITAEFGSPIQLGLGFTLKAVGGLLGLNRTMRLEVIATGIRDGGINSVMFPQDVVANAPRIISDLKKYFPVEEGTFLIGPMVKIGWGTPNLVTVSMGIIIEIPGNIAILGVLKVVLPDEAAPLIVIQVNFIGAIEFDKSRLWFFAAIFESRILYITLEGEMGLLVGWGDEPAFVVSVGGFHPAFNPPPLPFGAIARISISILNTDFARIRVTAYFAVTSNSVQFGAAAELFFGLSAFKIEGHLAFDALFRFSPFYFIITISASLSVKVFGVGLFSVHFNGSLEGPTPWHVEGTGSISLLFFDIDVDFSHTWGNEEETTLPPIAVVPLLVNEFQKLENWLAVLPASNKLLVSIRNIEPGTIDLILHPVGGLKISQRAVPLGFTIDKVGNQKPSDANLFNVSVSGLQEIGSVEESFAVGQFFAKSDDELLSAKSFEPLKGGVALSVAGDQYRASKAFKRVVRYEKIIIDTFFKRFVKKFFPWVGVLFNLFTNGNSASLSPLSNKQQKQLKPFADKVQIGKTLYVVAHNEDNTPFQEGAIGFTSQAQAQEYLSQQIAADANLAKQLHVIPQVEMQSAS